MGTKRERAPAAETGAERNVEQVRVPAPTASFRRRAWVEFQRALDPLAPIRPQPPPRA
jgi:hypothetical protein